MIDTFTLTRNQLDRQLSHWELASAELGNLEDSASPQAWASLERYVGVALRKNLKEAVDQLCREAQVIRAMFRAARTTQDLDRLCGEIVTFRSRYLRTETLVDYYGHAVNTRTNPDLSVNLRALDILAMKSLAAIIEPLNKQVPPILTYLDKGLGASILKAGLRLWDGSVSAVATVKVTYHNRRSPTALLHEVGHQAAHILDWNAELSQSLSEGIRKQSAALADLWASWASEIAADCVAFVHSGYGAVATLSDVVAADAPTVFRYLPGDPHPISYVRVLLGVEMCRRFYGRGAWDELAEAWVNRYPIAQADAVVRGLMEASRVAIPNIVEICLLRPARAFGDRPLVDLVDPARVAPAALQQLEADAGRSLTRSSDWIWRECIRLVALTGFRFATRPELSAETARLQDEWMNGLGREVESINTAAAA